MNPTILLSTFSAWRQRLACRIQEARRLRRDLRELARMSTHELRDLGISHAALAATAPRRSCCA
jgi:uncharacterized protein YjiS (DUF1127 family)